MVYKWFKNLDLLHIPMSLSYKNEYSYTTNIGAFLTIICFIIILSLSLYEIKSLSDKTSFTIITNQYKSIYRSFWTNWFFQETSFISTNR